MDLLLLALLVALAVWGARLVKRTWSRRSGRKARAATPGSSADNPIVLRAAGQLKEAMSAATCECGGRVKSLGETTRLGLRVARGRCVECDADVDLYFVLPKYVN